MSSATKEGLFRSIAFRTASSAHRSQSSRSQSTSLLLWEMTTKNKMEETTPMTIPKAVAWDAQSRTVSEGSMNSTTSAEQLALIGFAQRLFSVATNDERNTTDETDVRKEAQLLMSLSCLPPSNITIESGRASPSSDTSLGQSSGSRGRDNFTFSCPSLSLENRQLESDTQQSLLSSSTSCSSTATDRAPAVLLGRVLKVADVDALRLSSEAMARNIMQSYEKAIQWRIQSWIGSLSRVLVDKERELIASGLDNEANLKRIRESSEGLLIVFLRDISSKIRVEHAATDFKILSQRTKSSEDGNDEPPMKRPRRDSSIVSEQSGLTETDYEYSVSHLMTLECELSIEAPGVGNISIELKVPGTMKGVFLSVSDDYEHLTEVMLDINTDILASMIEKSSRMVVRSSVESSLGDNEGEKSQESKDNVPLSQEVSLSQEAKEEVADNSHLATPTASALSTPKAALSEGRMSNIALVTPKDSSLREFHSNHEQIILSFPDSSSEDEKPILVPKPKRSRTMDIVSAFSTGFQSTKSMGTVSPTVVTPSKTVHEYTDGKTQGPNLPALVEIALQYHTK